MFLFLLPLSLGCVVALPLLCPSGGDARARNPKGEAGAVFNTVGTLAVTLGLRRAVRLSVFFLLKPAPEGVLCP